MNICVLRFCVPLLFSVCSDVAEVDGDDRSLFHNGVCGNRLVGGGGTALGVACDADIEACIRKGFIRFFCGHANHVRYESCFFLSVLTGVKDDLSVFLHNGAA